MYRMSRQLFCRTMEALRLTPFHLYSVAGRGIDPEDVLLPSLREAGEVGVATRADLFSTTVDALDRIIQILGVAPVRVWDERDAAPAAFHRGDTVLYSFCVRHVIAVGYRVLEWAGEAEVEYADFDGDGEYEAAVVPGIADLLTAMAEENPPDVRSRVSVVLAIPDDLRTDGLTGPEGEWVIAENYDYGRPGVLPSPLFVLPELLVGLTEPLTPVPESFVSYVDVYREQFIPVSTMYSESGRVRLNPVPPPLWWNSSGPSDGCVPLAPIRLWVYHGLDLPSALAKCVAADLTVDVCVRGLARSVIDRLRADLALDEGVRVYPDVAAQLGTRLGHYEAYVELMRR